VTHEEIGSYSPRKLIKTTECPHHGKSMKLVPMPKPQWMLTGLTDSPERQMWKCVASGYPRVAF
jgi:hypothetical protein